MLDHIVGIEIIDSEHKEIYDTCVALSKALQGEPTEYSAKDLVSILYASCHFHSRNEEHLLAGWPGLKNHQGHHHELLYKLELLYQAIKKHKDDPEKLKHDLDLLLSFMFDWMINHVAEDRKFVPYLLSLGLKPSEQ